MAFDFKAPDYVAQFRCLGGDCEDTCCQHWDIHFDKHHYELLAEKVVGDPHEQRLFERYIRRLDAETAEDRHYARVEFTESGYCPFLETDGLCHIHSRFGVAPLSNICAFYPRVLSRWGNTVEIAGALSCPEMVRLCLRSEHSFKTQRVDAGILPRPDDYPLSRSFDPTSADDYVRAFMQVRETFIKLGQERDFSIETRLYAMASLAQRLSAFYHRRATVQSFRVDNECKRILDASVLGSLDEFCSRYEVDEPVSMVVAQSILQLRLQTAPKEKLAAMINENVSSYRQELGIAGDSAVFDLPPLRLWEAYQRRSETVNEVFGVMLEEYLGRYLLNCLYREWFVNMPDAFSYVQMLIIRLNLLRFLLISSPAVQDIALSIRDRNTEPDQLARDGFERAVVYIVYNFARSIDHNMPFLQVLYQAMAEQQMITFDYSLAFIKG
jgi:lysine-N-methylase